MQEPWVQSLGWEDPQRRAWQLTPVLHSSMQPHRWQPTRLPRPWDSPGKNAGVGCHFLVQCMKVKSESEVAQSCPTLRDLMDCSLPGSSIHGIFPGKSTEVGCHCLLWAYMSILDIFVKWITEYLNKEMNIYLEVFLEVSWELQNSFQLNFFLICLPSGFCTCTCDVHMWHPSHAPVCVNELRTPSRMEGSVSQQCRVGRTEPSTTSKQVAQHFLMKEGLSYSSCWITGRASFSDLQW